MTVTPSGTYTLAERTDYYRTLCDILIESDAFRHGIVSEATDMRLIDFLDRAWLDPYLRRWLCADNRAGSAVSETHFLAMLGWMQRNGMFGPRVTKLKLATFLAAQYDLVMNIQTKSIRNALSLCPGPTTRLKLKKLLSKC